jgi:hypothetical protein
MVSVPYTGTRFLRQILDANGCPPIEQIHTFVAAKWDHWFDGPVVAPMRDPVLHAITCENRGRPRNHLDGYETLASLANDRTHFFCVDQDPEGQWRGLEMFLGRPLIGEWQSVGHGEDVTGVRARYMATGEVPNPAWLDEIGDGTRALLRRLGYTMRWLEA